MRMGVMKIHMSHDLPGEYILQVFIPQCHSRLTANRTTWNSSDWERWNAGG